jgi:hypothetical protein
MEKYWYNIENTIASKQNAVLRFTFLGFHLLQIGICIQIFWQKTFGKDFFSRLYHKVVFFGLNIWTKTSSFRQRIIFRPRPKNIFCTLCCFKQ